MKTNQLFATALFAVGVCVNLASCSNDAVEAVSEDSVVRLTSNIAAITRGTDLNRQATQIVENQQIGVTITNAKEAHDNVAWTSGANGALSCDQIVYFNGDNTINIETYHPYVKSTDFDENNKFNLSVSTDQSTDEGYLNSDWLYCSRSNVTKKQSPVTLTFAHQMAKINVKVKSGTDFEDAALIGAEVWICGVKNGANVTLSEMSSTTKYETFISDVPVDIKAAVISDDGKIDEQDGTVAFTATAIIMPQLVQSGTKFIKVKVGDNNYYYKLANPTTFWWKNVYTYTLTLKKTQADLKDAEINDWIGADGNTTDGEAEEGE